MTTDHAGRRPDRTRGKELTRGRSAGGAPQPTSRPFGRSTSAGIAARLPAARWAMPATTTVRYTERLPKSPARRSQVARSGLRLLRPHGGLRPRGTRRMSSWRWPGSTPGATAEPAYDAARRRVDALMPTTAAAQSTVLVAQVAGHRRRPCAGRHRSGASGRNESTTDRTSRRPQLRAGGREVRRVHSRRRHLSGRASASGWN